MHEEIMLAIARANPYTLTDIKGVFHIVDSYDDTIKIINIARSSKVALIDVAHAMSSEIV